MRGFDKPIMGYYEVQNLCWVLGMLLYLLRHLSHHPSRLWFGCVTVCHLIIDCVWIVFVDCSINQMCWLIQIGKHIIRWLLNNIFCTTHDFNSHQPNCSSTMTTMTNHGIIQFWLHENNKCCENPILTNLFYVWIFWDQHMDTYDLQSGLYMTTASKHCINIISRQNTKTNGPTAILIMLSSEPHVYQLSRDPQKQTVLPAQPMYGSPGTSIFTYVTSNQEYFRQL